MSKVVDHEIEPDDEELCTTHMHYRPCRLCRAEAQEARAEAERDDLADPANTH